MARSAAFAKSKCPASALAERSKDLCAAFGLKLPRDPGHDELQALVAGLAGPAIAARDPSRVRLSGVAPCLTDGFWREGFIVNALS
jgi:hypothetical protein